jgi:hypothetical protein
MASTNNDDGKSWHCLRIPEILERIALELEESYGDRARCAALLGLGLICKALFDPAMDLLWIKQKGLTQLIKTFPQQIWKVSSRKSANAGHSPATVTKQLVSKRILSTFYS